MKATIYAATATRPTLRIANPDHRGFCMVSFLNADGAFEDIGSIVKVETGWQGANGGFFYNSKRGAAEFRFDYHRWLREDYELRPLN